MSDPLILDEDVGCERCGYNLRGLPTRHTCPECGEPYDESTEVAWLSADFKAMARRIGFPSDAVLIVKRGVGRAIKVHAAAIESGEREPGTDLTALDVCRAFREVVAEHFRDQAEAHWLLSAWGLRRSEDVGAVVFGLVREGNLLASADDSPADFVGLFVLENLFETPHPVLDRGVAGGRDKPEIPDAGRGRNGRPLGS